MIHLSLSSLLLLTLSQLTFLSNAQDLALNERPQVWFGIWTNPEHGYSDTPDTFNRRLGINASVFQIAQLIPLPKYNYTTGGGGPAPEYLIEQTNTDAAVFLTVYPTSLDIPDSDLNLLATQLASYTNTTTLNRTVFLRFAPEMQGTWNPYGFQPTAFIALWRRMYPIIKAASPTTAIAWAPNTGQSYPYGQSTANLSPADLALLDTNKDGQVNNSDDPYLPYYPGDDMVDWIGISTYYKGPNYQNINVAQVGGYCGSVLNGTSGTSTFNFYNTFCTKPGKACMIAESGAAWHEQAANSAQSTTKSIVDLQRAWWQDCITSTTFLNQFPRLKLTMHFEHEKLETDGGNSDLRDYRLTNDTAMLAAFQADLQTVLPLYVQPSPRERPAGIPAQGRPTAVPGTSTPGSPQGSTPTGGIVFQTARVPLVTGPPTLFGVKRKSAASSNWDGVTVAILSGFGIGFMLVSRLS